MRTRPPGPKGLPVVGNGYHYARDPFAFLDACGRAYDDCFRLQFGPQSMYVVTDPGAIRRVLTVEDETFRKVRFQERALDRLLGDGLLLSEGDHWRKMRRLQTPAFHPDRIDDLVGPMVGHTETMCDDWSPGETVDVASEMSRLTVRIITDAMFGEPLPDDRIDDVEDALLPVGHQFEPDFRRSVLPPWLPVPLEREYADAVGTLDRVVEELVARREAETDPGESPEGDDLLGILVAARQAGTIDDEALRDELVTTLLAGHDTTALALTYAWYLLSEQPGNSGEGDPEDALHREVDSVLDGRSPRTTDDLDELAHTERVMLESMRLYPPVYAIFRRPEVDVKLAGYRVPADTPVMLPQWVVHRDPRWYDDPEAFDPDRWTADRSVDRPSFAYFPFGAGPRACIGRGFAMAEARAVLATVASRYRLSHEGDELGLRASITMHPDGPVQMRVEER